MNQKDNRIEMFIIIIFFWANILGLGGCTTLSGKGRLEEGRSAIEIITAQPKRAKYCPVGGEHYAPNITLCPVHQVPLKTVED